MNQLKVRDIPTDLLAKIDEQFNQHPKIRKMRIKQQMLTARGMIAQALDIGKEIEELHTRAIYGYMQMAEDEASNLHLEDVDLDKEDEEFLRTAEIALFMACDVINCCLIDMNDTLHRKDKTLNYERFNDMKQLIDMVKAKMEYIRQHSGYLNRATWGTVCDDASNVLYNKAKKIIRQYACSK
jgi:hypothetical protein